MKKVGIIGGLGPGTTSKFYLELVYLCQKFNKINRPGILIYSVPIPYDIEKSAIISGKNTKQCIPLLLTAAKKLEEAGADFLVMPCNSLHIFIEEIRNSVRIPVFSIISETAKFLKAKKIREIGIVSTLVTVDKKLYENYFLDNNIKVITLNHSQQIKVGKIIHNLVIGEYCDSDRKEFINIIKCLEKMGAKHILLACTDLQLLQTQYSHLKIYDTMKIFANSIAQKILEI